MKNLLCLFLSLFLSFVAFSQNSDAADELLTQLLDAFVEDSDNSFSYVKDNRILVQADMKKIKIKEHKIGNYTFIIGELNDIEKKSPYLEVTKIKVNGENIEGELKGRNAANIQFSIKTSNTDNKAFKKTAKDDFDEFTIILKYLLEVEKTNNAVRVQEIIQNDTVYFDVVQENHCPKTIDFMGYKIFLINPTADNMEKCNNKYIQILQYEANKKTKKLELSYRLINNDHMNSVNVICNPCRSFF